MTEIIKIDTGLELEVMGEYFKAEEESNLPEQFEIAIINLVRGDLYDYSEWVAANHNRYLDIIEELVLNKINS